MSTPATARRGSSRCAPCSSDSVLGSIVLMIVYGYLLLRGAQLLSNGSELLLEVISPGIIGGSPYILFQSHCLH